MTSNQASHERLTSRETVHIGSDRAFGMVFGVVFSAIGLWPLVMSTPPRLWALILAALFFLTALFRPTLLRHFNHLWFKFGLLLHHIINPLILGLMFYLSVTPIALIMRLAGKDTLGLAFDSNVDSYWIPRQQQTAYGDGMQRQY